VIEKDDTFARNDVLLDDRVQSPFLWIHLAVVLKQIEIVIQTFSLE
jgi:hypothetical protein